MCEPRRSCSINKDTGLSAAYTIAHELGHNLGMQHDSENDAECSSGKGTIMAPSLQAADGHVFWSDCSWRALQDFLGSEQSRCLDDQPSGKWQFLFPSVLPGRIYDAHAQCRLQFGPKSKSCPFTHTKSICRELWCLVGSRKCESKFLPPAEGTTCGIDKWCRMGDCVPEGDTGPRPVDGQWSTWTTWSTCSRSCGGGVRQRKRKCDNPRSRYGGKFCDGPSAEHLLCNVQDCPPGGVDVRDAQCAAFDGKPFRGHYYRWTSYTREITGIAKCRLYCKARGWEFVAALSEKVSDGAPCTFREEDAAGTRSSGAGSAGRCVDGRCRSIGCDNRLDSRAVPDQCGICGGNATADCNGSDPGARSDERRRRRWWWGAKSGRVTRNGGRWIPETEDDPDEFLPEPCVGWLSPCTVQWEPEAWGVCSSCGPLDVSGLQKRKLRCTLRHNNGTIIQQNVPRRRCELMPDDQRPTRKRVCSCPPRWHVGGWQSCRTTNPEVTCGAGVRQRQVSCRMPRSDGVGSDRPLSPMACLSSGPADKVPEDTVPCRIPCTGRWHVMAWSQCSSSCGGGWKVRRVTCLHPASVAAGTALICPASSKPKTLMQCNSHSCLTTSSPVDYKLAGNRM